MIIENDIMIPPAPEPTDPNSIMVWDPIQQIWLEMTIIEDENEEGGV